MSKMHDKSDKASSATFYDEMGIAVIVLEITGTSAVSDRLVGIGPASTVSQTIRWKNVEIFQHCSNYDPYNNHIL